MEALNNAFKEFRKMGFIARQNYLCCQTCGFAGANTLVEEAQAKGKNVIGIVFYHAQDNERKRDGGDFHMSYDGVGDTDQETAGKLICKVLKRNDVVYDWNGDTGTRIGIDTKQTASNSIKIAQEARVKRQLKAEEVMKSKLRKSLEEKHGLSGHPKSDRLFQIAWLKGSLHGNTEVESQYGAMAELLK